MTKKEEITFELRHKHSVAIIRDGKKIGRIFTPSSSGSNILNSIQICGFSEAFDLWGCGPYQGFKDIQLLFDGVEMGGKPSRDYGRFLENCCRCYRKPCQCENKIEMSKDEIDLACSGVEPCNRENPFTVKRESELEDRLVRTKKK